MSEVCYRCGGKRRIATVGRGRAGGNAGGVVWVDCPACSGPIAVRQERERAQAQANAGAKAKGGLTRELLAPAWARR